MWKRDVSWMRGTSHNTAGAAACTVNHQVSELEQQRRTSECRLEIRTKPNKKQQARIFCGQSLPFLAEEFKTLFTIDEAGCITGADGRQKFPFYMRITDPFENLYGFDRMEGWVWIKQTQWTDSRGSPVLEGGFDFDLHHSFDSKGLPNPYGRALESCLAFKSHDEEVGADEWELLYEADEQ